MTNSRTIPQNVKGGTITFSIKIGGQEVPKKFQVFSVGIVKEANRIPLAKVTIIDGDPAAETFIASSEDLFLPGKEIEILAGHQSKEDVVFKGIIIKHGISARRNGTSQLKLECRDVAFKMTLGKKSAYYKDKKDSQIIKDLLSSAKVSIGTVDETTVKHPVMIQFDATDWDFMLTRMDVNGKLVLVNDGKADVKAPDFSSSPVLTLQYGATIHEFDTEIDVRNQYAAVKTLAWDTATQEIAKADGQSPSKVKENGDVTSNQLAEVGGLKEFSLRHSGNISRDELQAWANACRQKSALAKIRGRVCFDGFAKIKPGDTLELKGLGGRFNGKVFVSGIRHDIGSGKWMTTAQFGMDPEWFAARTSDAHGSGRLVPPISGLHTGVVAQLKDDPAGEHRILVKIPMVNLSGNGVWARVCTMDAGKERGSFFRPHIGDEVLVGFMDDDPRQAIVLGMLHSKKLAAPLKATDENKEKGFFFKSKMKMLFNEEEKSMTLETPGGNKIILSEKEKGITLQDQNGNKILMNKDGVTIESAAKLIFKASKGDIESEGMNIKAKASAQFKAEGSGGMELTSSAVAKLKGSLVQIN